MLKCCWSKIINIAFRGKNDKAYRALGWKSGNLDFTPSVVLCASGYFTLSEPQFPYWARSAFETGGLLKSLEELFGQAQTTFGVLMSSTRNAFFRIP